MIMNKPVSCVKTSSSSRIISLSLSYSTTVSLSDLIRQSLNKSKSFFLLFAIFFTFTSCTTTKLLHETYSTPEVLPIEELSPNPVVWTKIQDGFELTGDKIKTQRVSWHCVRIDLNTPGLSIVYAPHADTLGQLFKVKDFAKHYHTVVAINSAPFLIETTNYPVGILKDHNNIISAPNQKNCALAFYLSDDDEAPEADNTTRSLRAEILNNQEAALDSKYIYAFGGFYTTYENGEYKKFQHNKRSRIGCGISGNGRYLYIFATTPFFHLTDRNGLNYEECSMILKKLGCEKAMQFDGGHSSALLVYTKDIEKPFMQRKVPTALGIVAK